MKYKGTVVLESLIDDRILNDFEIVGFKVTNEEDSSSRWHLFTVLVAEENIKKFSNNLKHQKWYAHFWNNDNIIAVFPNKMFNFKYSDIKSWKKAVEYGKSLGIPEERLDFLIDN